MCMMHRKWCWENEFEWAFTDLVRDQCSSCSIQAPLRAASAASARAWRESSCLHIETFEIRKLAQKFTFTLVWNFEKWMCWRLQNDEENQVQVIQTFEHDSNEPFDFFRWHTTQHLQTNQLVLACLWTVESGCIHIGSHNEPLLEKSFWDAYSCKFTYVSGLAHSSSIRLTSPTVRRVCLGMASIRALSTWNRTSANSPTTNLPLCAPHSWQKDELPDHTNQVVQTNWSRTIWLCLALRGSVQLRSDWASLLLAGIFSNSMKILPSTFSRNP